MVQNAKVKYIYIYMCVCVCVCVCVFLGVLAPGFNYASAEVKDYPASLGVTCGQLPLVLYGQGLLLQISSYPNSSQC